MKKPKQIEFQLRTHGGQRKNAGRPKRLKSEPSHRRRERIDFKKPLHLTIKCAVGVPSLRTPKILPWFRKIVAGARAKGLHINQYAIEGNHIHLIAEADSNMSLRNGMLSFSATLTWALREIFHYCGKVLKGRFHTEICETPTQVKRALHYVIYNHAHHCKQRPFVDVYSSAAEGSFAQAPRSWLQRVGWRRGT